MPPFTVKRFTGRASRRLRPLAGFPAPSAANTPGPAARLAVRYLSGRRLRVISQGCRVCFVAALLCVAGGGEAREAEPAPGALLLAPFKRDLQQALRDGLAEGPVEAIAACRVRAPEIAAALSVDGVRVGRSSHRLRNPSNAAPEWVLPILEAYVADAAHRAPRTVDLAHGRSGYVEPILLQPMCLACHGKSLAPEVASRIEELYPADRATGFGVGDLRGVFWVEFPQPE